MFERRHTKRVGKAVRLSILIVFLGLIIMVLVVFKLYSRVFMPNVELDTDHVIFYVSDHTDLDELAGRLQSEAGLIDRKSFEWVAGKKGFGDKLSKGRYKIRDGISNNELVNMLRSGRQDPVMVVFNNVRNMELLAAKVSRYLEVDSASFADYLLDQKTPAVYGFSRENFYAMFIPNTYEFFWTDTPQTFCERMHREYERFWKGDRDKKAEKIGMSRTEVVTLASIVDEETMFDEENRRVAGLYMNRIAKGIPLQADPTLKFAMGDFTLKRILNEDKHIESPYNTYKYKGLPPGPIVIPSVSAVDAVLDYEKHRYLFMCAKADFSGRHAFAKTLAQHNRNASAYQRALNKKRIYR
ncbi:MAG: aminodeoxychorismate lyase [Bacteroidetes bacterium]|nr:MAG: aminodeoxychorismate lyase [Bacteroidota bacterium]